VAVRVGVAVGVEVADALAVGVETERSRSHGNVERCVSWRKDFRRLSQYWLERVLQVAQNRSHSMNVGPDKSEHAPARDDGGKVNADPPTRCAPLLPAVACAGNKGALTTPRINARQTAMRRCRPIVDPPLLTSNRHPVVVGQETGAASDHRKRALARHSMLPGGDQPSITWPPRLDADERQYPSP
jgi:hypothetical protein